MDAPKVNPPDSLPPKVVSQNARRAFPEEEAIAGDLMAWRPSGRMERRLAGNFPVLQAFQDFLVVERQRARRQMLALIGMFAVVLTGVLAVSIMVGFTLYHRTRIDIAAVQTDVQAMRAQGATLASLQTRMEQVAQTAADLRQTVGDDTAAQSRGLAQQDETLDVLHRQMAEMEERNRKLGQNLEDMRSLVPSLSKDLGTVVSLLQSRNRAADPPAPPIVMGPEPRLPDVPSEAEAQTLAPISLAIVVTPRGTELPVVWRLFIPE